MSFSAATYNILANAYVRPERYPHSPPESLDPTRRRRLLLDRIASLDVDLLCLQEVEPEAHADIAARLGDGYTGEFAKRSGRPDGSSIFVRRTSLSLDGCEVVRFRNHDPGDEQLALLARVRLGDHRLTVASTHLQWCADTTPEPKHTGRAQMIELLDHLARHDPDSTWIVAGDMNATSQSGVIRAALDRKLVLSAANQRPWDTCNANGRPRKLDYLLVSVGRLDPRPGVLPKLNRDTPMPSLSEPSDHLPLRVDFTVQE